MSLGYFALRMELPVDWAFFFVPPFRVPRSPFRLRVFGGVCGENAALTLLAAFNDDVYFQAPLSDAYSLLNVSVQSVEITVRVLFFLITKRFYKIIRDMGFVFSFGCSGSGCKPGNWFGCGSQSFAPTR